MITNGTPLTLDRQEGGTEEASDERPLVKTW